MVQVFDLLLAVAGSEKTREVIRSWAEEAGKELLAEREGTWEAEVLSVVAELARENRALAVAQIAERFLERHEFDYDYRIAPRWVGYMLRRRLRLKTRKSHRVFVVPPGESAKLRRLYLRYGVSGEGLAGKSKT